MAESLDVGVYVVTAAGLVDGRSHLDVANAALAGGADVVQVRAPELDRDQLRGLARDVAAAARATRTVCVINDDLEVALDVEATGVHLGQADLAQRGYAMGAIRQRLGSERVLGISASDVDQARTAEENGADYLGVTVFQTDTKSEADPVGLDGLESIAAAVTIPVVAIGGIHEGNAREALRAGATGIAVVSAVAGAEDPVAATERLREVVAAHRSPD
ncbi:MAG: thiamine phosphate synthase [Nitriliruptorales bacterium]|nr:thiamine phosphate synthase [Nitriliruptorales bacterium]